MARTNKDILRTKLETIADTIRSKSGSTAKMTLDQMAVEVGGLAVVPQASKADEAVAEIDAVWGTDSLWATIAKHGDTVRMYPGKFEKYIGQTTTYTHSSYGSQEVRCVDICHFDKADGSKAAFCFDHVYAYESANMNSTETTYSDSYITTDMKEFIDTTFYNGISSSLKTFITPVTIKCSQGDNTIVYSPDNKIFLPSVSELTRNGAKDGEGFPITYYATLGTGGNYSYRKKDKANGNYKDWWTRTICPYPAKFKYNTGGEGYLKESETTYSKGVSPLFNVG